MLDPPHCTFNDFICSGALRSRRTFRLRILNDDGKLSGMLIIHVHVHVKPECIDAFREASVENAGHSIREPGIAQFDLLQQNDDPTRFLLLEVYRDQAANDAHKETAHYAKWRDTVAPMMAEPRRRTIYSKISPDESCG